MRMLTFALDYHCSRGKKATKFTFHQLMHSTRINWKHYQSRQTVRRHTRTDTELSQVYEYVQTGWPTKAPPHLQAYYNRRNELSTSHGCIIWGTRVVIPKSSRSQLLQELHVGHLGMVRMKNVARSFIWWPWIDTEIETTAKQCIDCKLY